MFLSSDIIGALPVPLVQCFCARQRLRVHMPRFLASLQCDSHERLSVRNQIFKCATAPQLQRSAT